MVVRPRSDYDQIWMSVCWGPRHETPRQISARIGETMSCLGRASSGLSQWHAVLRDKPAKILATPKSLASFLIKDDFGRVMQPESYSISLENSPRSKTRGTLNMWVGVSWRGAANHVILTVVCDKRKPLFTFKAMRRLFAGLIDVWEPDHGTAAPSDLWDQLPTACNTAPRTGWLVYFSRSMFGDREAPPAPIQSVDLKGQGVLLWTTQSLFLTQNKRHLAAAHRLQETYPDLFGFSQKKKSRSSKAKRI